MLSSLILLSTALTLSSAWSGSEYLVSLDGVDDDNLSGSESDPWRTLSYAVQRIRKIRNHNNPPGPENTATIYISGDIHYLPETLQLDRRDEFLTMSNYRGQKVIISGGFPLDIQWKQQSDILTGSYEGDCGEMYYGDFRMMKARSPNIANYGVNEHYGTGPYHKVKGFLVENDQCNPDGHGFSQNCPAENKNGFYLDEEMSPDWTDLDQTQILYFHSWVNEYTRVANVTLENGRHKVMFQEPLAHAAVGTWIRSGNLRYIVVNNLAVLDSPGEFVCIQSGNVSTVSWIPPQGVSPDIVPVMSKLEKVLSTGNIDNVSIEGLSFQHTNHYGLDTGMDFQHAAVTVTNSNNVNIINCEFSHTGMMGLFVSHSSNVLIDRNVFTDIAYHGILHLGPDHENITITNNYIDGVGITRYWETNAVFNSGGIDVLIANNEVTRSSGGAMHVISNKHGKHDFIEDWVINVEYNYIHDFGAGITNDFGGIKTGSQAHCDDLSEQEMEEVCFAYIRVYNNMVTNGKSYYCCANLLYSDVSASKNLFENNILYGSADTAIIHHCGIENESKNNIVHRNIEPENGEQPISDLWGLCEANKDKHQAFNNHLNIYYFENTEDFHLYRPYNFFDERSVFTDNLYWSLISEDESKGLFPPDDLSFGDLPPEDRNQWADPQFSGPEFHNYLLAEGSPALAMGIQQIRLDNFGIQADRKPFYLS